MPRMAGSAGASESCFSEVEGPVLVTGANGLVGRALCERLVSNGVSTVGLLRRRRAAEELERTRVRCVVADDWTDAVLAEALEGCRAVLHCAASTSRSHGNRREVEAMNVAFPSRLLRAAGRHGVRRFVHCSTTGVHGPLRRWPATEEAALRPDSRYRRSKLAGERRLRRVEAEGGDALPELVVARLTSLAGKRMGTWNSLVASVREGRVNLVGGGRNVTHVSDLDDVCQGLALCAARPRAAGRTYFLGGDEFGTQRDLLERVSRALGQRSLRFRSIPSWPLSPLSEASLRLWSAFAWEPALLHRLSFLCANRAYSMRRAVDELGFRPRAGLDEVAASMVEAWRRSTEGEAIGNTA
ncbi:MAG: NAD-dependent epimerase/dehydratase family protein [Acidobacteriota bacterium]